MPTDRTGAHNLHRPHRPAQHPQPEAQPAAPARPGLAAAAAGAVTVTAVAAIAMAVGVDFELPDGGEPSPLIGSERAGGGVHAAGHPWALACTMNRRADWPQPATDVRVDR
ncbi:DUF6069 family protein [Micromonospora sp. NPDC094482]|uniref:DUF6069 family protein n=1 Tax=unclassified Micromonospora TaxID=2617518 RepID=UPI003329B22F